MHQRAKSGPFPNNWRKVMLSNTFIFGFLNGGSLFLSFVSERDKILPGLNKVKKSLFKILFHFFNTFILIKIILFFVPDSLAVRYPGANSCGYSFGTSALSGSITQLPGFLLHPLTCTLLKPGITHTVVEVFVTAIIVAGIIALHFENKYFSQKPAIERNALNFRQMRDIIGAHLTIKREHKDKKNFVYIENGMLPEVLRISGGSRFCWIDMYGGNMYGPIFWEERSEEPENEADIAVRTEMELKFRV
jgi:hypothetical protein